MDRLLLFDIDGTLLDTGGAGGGALLDAVEEVFGVARHRLKPLQLAGATDYGVIRDICRQVEADFCEATLARYLEAYERSLRCRLEGGGSAGKVLPGVRRVLELLCKAEGVHLGLLTGNVRAGAAAKLSHFGLSDYFLDGAFGDDAEDRNCLGPFAVQRLEMVTGCVFPVEEVIVVGDTPKDVACAKALGARCLAVGTGIFSRSELLPHAPWQCLDSLADADFVCELLMS